MKVSVLCEVTQFFVQHPQTLARHFVGRHVIDADLQRLKPRVVQPLDAFGREVIAV